MAPPSPPHTPCPLAPLLPPPCTCGSIISGQRRAFDTMMPFSTDTLSVGKPAMVHDRTFTGSCNVLIRLVPWVCGTDKEDRCLTHSETRDCLEGGGGGGERGRGRGRGDSVGEGGMYERAVPQGERFSVCVGGGEGTNPALPGHKGIYIVKHPIPYTAIPQGLDPRPRVPGPRSQALDPSLQIPRPQDFRPQTP